MKNKNRYISALLLSANILFVSCKDETKDMLTPFPADINFEDQMVESLSYRIPDAPFKAGDASTGIITVNSKKNTDGTFSGFALSTKTWRSYPWSLSPTFGPANLDAAKTKMAIDSTIFSVYTAPAPNQTKNYLVGYTKDEDASITFDNPSVVEHALVANNTYNFLLATYGSKYSGTLDANSQEYSLSGTVVRNLNNPNTSTAMYGRFYLPAPGGVSAIRLEGQEIIAKKAAGKAAADAARLAGKPDVQVKSDSVTAYTATVKGYIKLAITGYNGAKNNGTVDFYLAVRPQVDLLNPAYNIVLSNWNKVSLSSLGLVTRLVFSVTSSSPNIPPYFCLDGLRIRK